MLTNAVEIKGIKIHVTSKRFPEPTGEGRASTASYTGHVNISGDREEAGGRRAQSHSLVLLTSLTPSPPRLSNWSKYANEELASIRERTWKNAVRQRNQCGAFKEERK